MRVWCLQAEICKNAGASATMVYAGVKKEERYRGSDNTFSLQKAQSLKKISLEL
jgi:hypothetical protein